MKISLNWLKTLLDTDLAPEELANYLTGCGLEVEGRETFETVKGGMRGLVVGEVLECAKHPDADRLSITKVDIGNGSPLAIVCGAPNVAAGQKVIVATVGTRLYPAQGEPFDIKKSKIRGQPSEGMICAEDEIGLGNSHAGIIVLDPETTPGTTAAQLYNLENDEILEIGLTPNRGDAASHYGVARDLAAVLNSRKQVHSYAAKMPHLKDLPSPEQPVNLQIEVQDKIACPRYSGIVITGIKVGESPAWLQNRLRSVGLRPLNNVVDITNFVLFELGQPLHAFDLQKIDGEKIIVRRAKEKEKFVTLDGVARELSAKDLMICNASTPMCIAGVFGGEESGVTEQTTSVFIESAYFDPSTVRQSSKHHGLKTDASFRFERGVDPEMTINALVRAANLILEIAGGTPATAVLDVYPEKLNPYKVAFSYKNCSDLVGKEMDRATMKNIILNLGMEIDSEGTDGLLLYVPRYKHDVTREADVIEDVMRIYGYDLVEPSRHITYGIPARAPQAGTGLEERIATLLSANGFNEMMGLSLSPSSYYSRQEELLKILNPLSSDLNVLRNEMIFGGLEAIAHNINRQHHNLKLYEFGRTYSKAATGEYEEKKQLSIFITGRLFKENPYGLTQDADFTYLRSVVQTLFNACGIAKTTGVETTSTHFSYGLDFSLNKTPLAEAGLVKNSLLKDFDIKQPVFYASVNWDAVVATSVKQKITFEEPGKFPSVRRDLALLLDKTVKYSQIEELAFDTEKKLLSDVNLFDIYEDEKLGNKRSYAISFTLLDRQATLTDKQIDAVMDKLIKNYREKLGAELR